jgi:hypothetical protein
MRAVLGVPTVMRIAGATAAHFHESGHPVMRSIEPGENWRWCYVDVQLRA